MKNILKYIAVVSVFAALSTSCIKETELKTSSATSEQVADSPFALSGLLSSVPTQMMTQYLGTGNHYDFGYPGVMICTDHLAGEVFPACWYNGGNQYYDRFQYWMYNFGMGETGAGSQFYWIDYYKFINSANIMVSSTQAGSVENGMAKAYRALLYLDLARLYDALPAKAPKKASYEAALKDVEGLTVPIITEETSGNDNPRATREEMFTFILKDLNDAAEAMKDAKAPAKTNPSLPVVYGLLARTYLWLGGFENLSYPEVPTGVAAYKLAAEYAGKAISTFGAKPMTEAQYTDPVSGFNTINSAWMWAMQQSTDTVLNNLLSFTAHMSVDADYGYGALAQMGILKKLYDRLSDTDFRKKIIVGEDTSWEKYKDYTCLTEEQWSDDNIAPYAVLKFACNQGETTNYTVANVTAIPLMRVEEMYLTKAEAEAHYDNGTALATLKEFMAYRDPAYVYTGGSANLVDEIIFQKRIELWGEGLIFYDLKRLNYGLVGGEAGSNVPSGARWLTDGRAPWWNMVIFYKETQQNHAIEGLNNPDPSETYDSLD